MDIGSGLIIHLRCTIGGGLEDLAMTELQTRFPSCCLEWIQRGNSGSQLSLQIPTALWSVDALVQAMQQLRFVDYVYQVVHGQDYDTSFTTRDDDTTTDRNLRLLSQIQQTLDIDAEQLLLATSIGQRVQEVLRDKSVGLESLPGELLPTPTIEQDCNNKSPANPSLSQSLSLFDVNTIYTQDAVAKMVVEIFVQKVQDYLSLSTSSSHTNVIWLDAGAGSGALLQHLPGNYRLGIDIAPSLHPEVVCSNFLTVTRLQDLQPAKIPTKIMDNPNTILCVVSNPPFADGSRGDYSAIVQFVNHSTKVLHARYVGLIVPAKFVRPRIWVSLGMDPRVQLLARVVLPPHAFWDPAQPNQSIHIHAYFVIFGVQETSCLKIPCKIGSTKCSINSDANDTNPTATLTTTTTTPTFYLMGKRDKGAFPDIATTDLVQSVAKALSTKPLPSSSTSRPSPLPLSLVSEREAQFPLLVKLYQPNTMQQRQEQPNHHHHQQARLELWLLLNPERPLSLSNSMSCCISQHSLGWMSLSVKPPIAHAMLQPIIPSASTHANRNHGPTLIVNTMSGEGTIELESQGLLGFHGPIFVLAGDKKECNLMQTQQRLQELESRTNQKCWVDLIRWDAQRLPLRRDIVDLLVADLPFVGSTKVGAKSPKFHQTPTMHHVARQDDDGCSSKSTTRGDGERLPLSSLKYRSMMTQAIRVLAPQGMAALISADTKALLHSTRQLHWKVLPQYSIPRMNLGGLNAQLLVLEKLAPCTKDLSVWIEFNKERTTSGTTTIEWSQSLQDQCQKSIEGWYLNDETLEIQQDHGSERPSLVTRVTLVDQYFHERNQRWSHCYRITMDSRLTNHQAKTIEKRIRASLQTSPLPGISGIR